MSKFLKRLLLVFAVPAVLFGCAAPPLPDVAWPEPPDQPRIKFVRALRGSADFSSGGVAVDILLGSGQGNNLKKPMGVHADKNGKVYVTDTAAADVFVFDTKNSKMTTLVEMGARGFFKPISVTTDNKGRIFVTDSQVDKVAVLDQTGKMIQNLQPAEPFQQPTGVVADDANNRLYVTDTHSHDIRVFELDTLKPLKTIGKRGKEEGEFNFPSHISVDNKGNLYVVDTMNGRLQVFDVDGKFIRAFGQFGDSAGMFARPKGVGVDSEGHIFIVDAAFNNVQIFDIEGQILMSFSSYGADRGQLILPAGLSIDNEDYIYVVDSWNRRVNVYEYVGEKSKAREASKAKK
ncbi:MAG TPA: hypothetical protein DDW94_04530 [Deltaproteobacteria bacterium]|nr:MAG: hypothetical protein A3I81_11765 [Deltaproteobacteria bacterium RIFCSPLOWO2_02_FULL_55_12]HBG46240.1 hypothetical protein [Deltaproteobacteria bacterium]HCY10147.1 hypothetical protein [Deltaproteobacteria bacterium]